MCIWPVKFEVVRLDCTGFKRSDCTVTFVQRAVATMDDSLQQLATVGQERTLASDEQVRRKGPEEASLALRSPLRQLLLQLHVTLSFITIML